MPSPEHCHYFSYDTAVILQKNTSKLKHRISISFKLFLKEIFHCHCGRPPDLINALSSSDKDDSCNLTGVSFWTQSHSRSMGLTSTQHYSTAAQHKDDKVQSTGFPQHQTRMIVFFHRGYVLIAVQEVFSCCLDLFCQHTVLTSTAGVGSCHQIPQLFWEESSFCFSLFTVQGNAENI